MEKLGIFGGTREGRELAEFCRQEGILAVVSVATPYGAGLLDEGGSLTVHTGRMDGQAMCRWIGENGITAVIDATHPYARQASETIREACMQCGVWYERLVRDESLRKDEAKDERVFWAGSVEEAAALLEKELDAHPERKAFLTTGSKELSSFARIKGREEKLYARVLPSPEGIKACREAGIPGNHIIAMQGPFSCELNKAILKSIGADYLVTKESGQAGGFWEKLDAALSTGCRVIVVGRPKEERGKSLEEIKKQIRSEKQSGMERQQGKGQASGSENGIREIVLAGIGMGAFGQITWDGIEAIGTSDGLLGASRMVDSGMAVRERWENLSGNRPGRIQSCVTYKPEEMLSWLDAHPEVKKPVVLYSGDPGFYSGASSLIRKIREEKRPYLCRVIPGISTLSYFGAKLGKSWEKVEAASLHGRDAEVDWSLSDGKERFILLDGEERFHSVCRKLIEQGQEKAVIWVGERLSCQDERIVSGSPKAFLEAKFKMLLAAWIIPAKEVQ